MTVPSRTISLAATAAAGAASALAYPFLPGRVATHFAEDGLPDGYGSRISGAVGFPVVMAGLTLLNDRLGAWPGGRDREDVGSGVQARDEAVALVQLAFLSAHLTILANAVGLRVDVGRVNRGVLGLLMIGLGNLMPKLPRNGLVGIRTPWTMANPAVWERTHRLGGYLITGAGLATLLSLPAGKRASRLPLRALLGAVGLSAAYSLAAYARRAGSNR